MKDDPVISRVREARHQISEACGHDPKKLVEYYMKRQQEREKQQTLSKEAMPEREA